MPDEVTMSGENVDFDKFFDDIAAGKVPAATETPAVETPAVTTVTTPAVETPAVETPTVAETPAVETPAVETPAEPTTREVLETFMKTMTASKQPVETPKPAAPQAQPVWNDAEMATLAQFEKDYPDMAKAMGIMLSGALKQNNAHTFDQISRVIAPAISNVDAIADAHALSELRQLIPDYDKVRAPVVKWVQEDPKLPAYLRRAYVSVIEEGEASDIADVVGQWRLATGTKAPAATPPKASIELSEAAKQAALTLAPVISQRSATVQGEPTTYDDAFEAAVAAMAKAS